MFANVTGRALHSSGGYRSSITSRLRGFPEVMLESFLRPARYIAERRGGALHSLTASAKCFVHPAKRPVGTRRNHQRQARRGNAAPDSNQNGAKKAFV
jgi:hypothetical protein